MALCNKVSEELSFVLLNCIYKYCFEEKNFNKELEVLKLFDVGDWF